MYTNGIQCLTGSLSAIRNHPWVHLRPCDHYWSSSEIPFLGYGSSCSSIYSQGDSWGIFTHWRPEIYQTLASCENTNILVFNVCSLTFSEDELSIQIPSKNLTCSLKCWNSFRLIKLIMIFWHFNYLLGYLQMNWRFSVHLLNSRTHSFTDTASLLKHKYTSILRDNMHFPSWCVLIWTSTYCHWKIS